MLPSDADNGILAAMPPGYCSAGVHLLPHPGLNAPERCRVVFDAPHVGRVVLTYRRMQNQRFRNHFWIACHAAQVGPDEPLGLVVAE
ncbi:hypothetical protein GCM10025795_02140 [Verticiella sediminum]